MSTIIREFFRITHNGEHISFGPRELGEKGRDILAVKSAIGVISSPANISSNKEDSSLGDNGWFDCVTGERISAAQGATFDAKTGQIKNVPLKNMDIQQIRNNAQFVI